MEYKSYNTDLKELKNTLDKYGVAVIPNVLNTDELKSMKSGMWKMLYTLTEKFDVPIKEENRESWKSFYELIPLHSMLLQYYKVGHSQFVWDLRQNEKIVNIFASLWNCKPEDLLTSFDGLSIHFPPEVTKRGWYKSNDWLHTDQSYTRNNYECVQSFVTGYDINEGDATLTLLEGSHKFHKDFATKFNKTDKADWYKLTPVEYQYYIDKGCKRTCVTCPAGSIVLWDSRTIHCGMEAQKTRKRANMRLVVYICQTPRKWSDKKNIEKKQKAFNEMRMTTHWPHKVKLFGLNPRTYGKEMPSVSDLPKPQLSKLGLSLAGF